MSLPAQTRQLSTVENYTLQVIGDEQHEAALWRDLPSHMSPGRYKRALINLFTQKPEMLQYDPRAVFREVSKAVGLGLSLDPQFGEAYIVPVWNSKTGRKEPELRCGYRGIIKLARQSDEIANIYPGEVCENDLFIDKQGTDKRLEHQPDHKKPRGKPICYYAVVHYKDGTHDHEVMDMDSLYAIRERSDGWRAFRAGKIKSTPWATDEGEMCKKTPLRRLLKRVPQSPELSEALAMENAADFAPNTPRLAPQPSRQLHVVETSQTIEHDPAETFPDDDAPGDDAPSFITAEQVAELTALANAGGANIAKVCEWAGVREFSELPAEHFDRVREALEAKRRKATQSTSAAAEASPAASPAVSNPAGDPPASEHTPAADAGGNPDPLEEARAAGRAACEAGVDFKDIPEKYKRYTSYRKAWEDGFQKQAEEMGA